LEKVKRTCLLEYLGVVDMIILKRFEYMVEVVWLRIKSIGGLLWTEN
jgi:hypothetical protein